jgi:four helix bundle protein
MEREVSLEEWVETIPDSLRSDPLWKSDYYRLAMYLYDLVWLDCESLNRDNRGQKLMGQLLRSAASICANMEEAYGRGVGTPDYIRVMRISSGETRETKGHYLRFRHILSTEIIDKRLKIIDQVIVKLVSTLSTHRKKLLRS